MTCAEDAYDTAHRLVAIGFWEHSALPVHTVKATFTFSMPNATAETCVDLLWFDGICGNCGQKSRVSPYTTICPKCGAAINVDDTWVELVADAYKAQTLRDYWSDQL